MITITPSEGERYQGVVGLEGDTLAACLEDYFMRSEQLLTRLFIRTGDVDGKPAAGGMLLQVRPRRCRLQRRRGRGELVEERDRRPPSRCQPARPRRRRASDTAPSGPITGRPAKSDGSEWVMITVSTCHPRSRADSTAAVFLAGVAPQQHRHPRADADAQRLQRVLVVDLLVTATSSTPAPRFGSQDPLSGHHAAPGQTFCGG